MCRNIRTLANFEPPATHDEIRASALQFVRKLAGPGTKIERLTVDGLPAIWIEGAQHFFFYRDPNGNIVENEMRLAQNVLLLERGRLLVRLEGAFDRAQAVAIARSLR